MTLSGFLAACGSGAGAAGGPSHASTGQPPASSATAPTTDGGTDAAPLSGTTPVTPTPDAVAPATGSDPIASSGDASTTPAPVDSGTTTGGSTAGTTTPAPAPLPPPPPPPPPPAPVQDVLPPANYALTWSDEFDGTALDTTKWGYMGPGTSVDPGDVSDTASLTVSNGLLTDQVFTDAGGIHHVGLLATEGKFQTLYGYVEARIKFHGALGSWCAFWIQSEKNGLVLDDTLASGTEIDVIEYRAYANEQQYIGDSGLLTLNWNGYVSGTRRTAGLFVASPTTPLQDNWHTYGVLWTPTKYTWYIDHYPMWESSLAPSGQPEFLLLTCQVWDKLWAGPVPAGGYGSQATSTVGMQVDYVRVWQEAPPLPPPSSDE